MDGRYVVAPTENGGTMVVFVMHVDHKLPSIMHSWTDMIAYRRLRCLKALYDSLAKPRFQAKPLAYGLDFKAICHNSYARIPLWS